MASPVNQHCANCIGTLSFPVQLSAAAARSWFVKVSFLLGDRITSKTQMPTPSRPIVAFTSDALPCAAVCVLRCVAARCESGVNVSLY